MRAGAGRRGGAFLLECSALASRPPCVPAGMFCARSRPPCVPVGMFRARSRPPRGSIAVFCARSRLPCVPAGMSCARSRPPCGSVGMACARSRPPCGSIAVFCARSRPPCGSVGMFRARLTPAVRSCWNVLRLPHARRAVLSRCSALASRPPCGSIAVFCARLTPAVRFYRGVLRSVHACCLTLSAKQDGLRYLAFLFRGSRSPFVRSRGVGADICLSGFTSGLCVYLWRSRRGYRGRGERGTEPAARCKCAFSQSHWLCNVFRGEYAGAPRPRLRQRVFDSLDSLHAAAGLRWCGFAAFVRFCVAALRPPQTAPKSLRLSGLSSFDSRRGCAWRGEGVREQQRLIFCSHVPQHSGTRRDLPESDLCSGKSGCTAMIPTSSNVQTRAARRQRRRVGLTRAKRSGRRHCRLSPRSPPCGW